MKFKNNPWESEGERKKGERTNTNKNINIYIFKQDLRRNVVKLVTAAVSCEAVVGWREGGGGPPSTAVVE